MNESIEKLVTDITEATTKGQWSKVDRLTLVLKELVKIEVAAIQGKSNA